MDPRAGVTRTIALRSDAMSGTPCPHRDNGFACGEPMEPLGRRLACSKCKSVWDIETRTRSVRDIDDAIAYEVVTILKPSDMKYPE